MVIERDGIKMLIHEHSVVAVLNDGTEHHFLCRTAALTAPSRLPSVQSTLSDPKECLA